MPMTLGEIIDRLIEESKEPYPELVECTVLFNARWRGQAILSTLDGERLAREVSSAPVGSWQGPVNSRFGAHLIRVTDRQPEGLPPFEEVEKQVRADWLTVETRGLRAAAESLLPEYDAFGAVRERAGSALPGIAPTGKYVEIAMVAIIGFRGDKLHHEHIYWDQASVLVQIGKLDPANLPVAGIDSARKVLDETMPSNQLMARWSGS